ncbi:Cysteine proteinase inhibitor 5, partial [Cucurbita argyrosperma subsp. sororia]
MSSVPGGPVPVDPNDPHVRDIGEWAVNEHNKQSGDSLKFLEVVSGSKQIVSGVLYKLVLLVDVGANYPRKYEAKVWEQPWVVPPRKLESFHVLLQD